LRMSFISCARSSWLRRASALALVLLPVAAAAGAERGRGGDIEQAWFRLAQVLDRPAPGALRERADELLQAAGKTGIDRLTPLALALVVQARTLAGPDAETVLIQATRLDPGSAEAWLALADVRLRHANLVAGLGALGRGVFYLVSDERLRGFIAATALLSALAGALAALAVWGVLAIRKVLPRLWHDLTETGARWRLGANSAILSLLVIALPLFVGGDPVWLVLWVFALSWAYFTAAQRVVGAAGLILVAVTPTLVEVGFRAVTHPPNAVIQATEVLADKRYEPQILDELNALADVLGDDPDYYLLTGDVDRQFGFLDQATLTYREGLRVAPQNAALALALGTVRYSEGDYNAALQSFQAALNYGYDPAVANYDLSLTYAQNYHFHESDDAMAAARLAGGERLAALVPARDRDIILPVFSLAQARAMLARKDPLVLLNRGLLPPPLARSRTLANPLAIGAVLALMVAVVHLLARRHFGGLAASCLKCGRPFCRHCKLSHESQSYCTQCVNIFLKKDMVGIDAQLAKRRQLLRRQASLRLERRLADLVVPGLGAGYGGRPVLGWLLAVVGVGGATAACLWLPAYVSPALMAVPVWPLEAAFALLWGAAIAAAQLLRVEWR
jgi:tetratricopeptide (TPR) repeat protein